jgi:hypothetical protein
MNFSPEILNYNLSFRPTHPIASLLKHDIEYWGRKRMYFNTYYFKKPCVNQMMIKRKQRIERNDEFYFKCCKEDGFTTEQAVKLRYESKLMKRRLNKKLDELSLKPWEISTQSSLNFLKAYHNGVEIFNEYKPYPKKCI